MSALNDKVSKNSQLNAVVEAIGKRGYVTLTKTTPEN